MPISSWTTHPMVISRHMIKCARCMTHASEQATIEAFTVLGQGYWSLCRKCMVDFNIFILVIFHACEPKYLNKLFFFKRARYNYYKE